MLDAWDDLIKESIDVERFMATDADGRVYIYPREPIFDEDSGNWLPGGFKNMFYDFVEEPDCPGDTLVKVRIRIERLEA